MDHGCSSEPWPRAARNWARVGIPAAAFSVGLVLAVAAAKSRPEPLRGVYRQEAVPVVATCCGKLISIDVPHGKPVVPGQRIAVVEDIDVSARAAELEGRRASLARELETASRRAVAELSERSAVLEKDRLDTRLRYADLLRVRLDVQVKRRALEGGGDRRETPIAGVRRTPVTPASVDESGRARRLDLADACNHEEVLNTQVALCEDRLDELDRAIEELPARIEQAHEVDRLRSELAALEGDLTRSSLVKPGTPVVSPAHGRIGVHRRRPNDLVAAGETLVEVFDAERPYVLATVGLAEARDLPPGTKVSVAFEGIETKKPLAGTVVEVRSEAETEADAAVTPGMLTARVRIVPAGRLWPTVPPGTTALIRVEP